LLIPGPASGVTPDTYQTRLSSGEYRHEWTWIAESSADDLPLAVAIWWGIDRSEGLPSSLDALLVRDSLEPADRARVASALLAEAQKFHARAGADGPAAFHVFLPPDWRSSPDATAALDWRAEATRDIGLTETLERLHFEFAAQIESVIP